jgi:hypothetical protein
MNRLERVYQMTIDAYGYRISPRMPLRYRSARSLQRVYWDTEHKLLSMGDANLLSGLLELSLNTRCATSIEIYKRNPKEPHKTYVTRYKGYPDGGVSILHYVKVVPHHSMTLRSHTVKKLAGAGDGMGGHRTEEVYNGQHYL